MRHRRLISLLVVCTFFVFMSTFVFAGSTIASSPSIKVQFYNPIKTDVTNTLYQGFKVYNTGSSTVSLSDIKIRYYYTVDGDKAQKFWGDWSTIGKANLTGTLVKMAKPRNGADYYLEVGFISGAGTLAPGASVEIQTRVTKTDWSNYTQNGDYSFNPTATTYTDWNKVTGYVSGTLSWGTDPNGKEILGFTTYYYSGDKSSYNVITANGTVIDEIATATHVTDASGNVTGLIPAEQITYANGNAIRPTLMLGNNFDGSVAQTLLESSANRKNLINNLLNLVQTNGYKGVNIDLEGVYASDRTYYTTFMSELYAVFKPAGFSVSISVPAKTADSPSYTWNYAYDYASLGSYVDSFMLMTYDEHYPGGTPGAIASVGWLQNVISYTQTVVPKEKILVGLAAYGYDWSSTGTKSYSIDGCNNLAAKYNAPILWDSVSQSPYFNYTDASGVSHSVWFENAQSIGYKLDLVNSMNAAGIGIWRLGLENTDFWSMIKAKLNK